MIFITVVNLTENIVSISMQPTYLCLNISRLYASDVHTMITCFIGAENLVAKVHIAFILSEQQHNALLNCFNFHLPTRCF